MAWNKGGLKCSLWVSRDQREHVSRGSQVHKFPRVGSVQDGPLVGLPVISFPKPTSPSWTEVGESPTMGDPRSLSLEAHALVLSETTHEASLALVALDIAEESPAPPKKAGTAQQQALMLTAASYSAKATVMEGIPFLMGFTPGLHWRHWMGLFQLLSTQPSIWVAMRRRQRRMRALFIVGFAPLTLR